MNEKKCSVCGELKPLWAFYKYRKNENVYRSYCIDCGRAMEKARYERRVGVVSC